LEDFLVSPDATLPPTGLVTVLLAYAGLKPRPLYDRFAAADDFVRYCAIERAV